MPILLWLMLVAPPPAEQAVQAAPPQSTSDTSHASTERIARALAKEPSVNVDPDERVFRIEIFGKKPTIFDFIGTDVLRGPVPHGSRAHQEFLQSVTPEDVRGYAPFSNSEGAVVAVTSMANAMLMQAVVETFNKVRRILRTRQEHAAHAEVLAALEELQRARAAAGLPAK